MLEIQNEPPPEQTVNFIGDSTNSQFHLNTFPNHAIAPNPNPNFSVHRPPPPRKRPWVAASPDHFLVADQVDIYGHAKVYVAPVPRTLSEDDIRLVFEVYGTIVEVVLLRDKATGARQGSCLVKYSTFNEAEMAIKALNNQYKFPGEAYPVVVKFADRARERERFGLRGGFCRNMEKKDPPEVVDKIFVSHINNEASTQDIEEIFSPYGVIEDVYIVRNRGYGFVRFSKREMALAAIKGLNNTFTMRGCDQPLIVRFAEPKKPKMGESRGNYLPANANFGPTSQEPAVWPLPNFCDSNTGGSVAHIAPHHSRLPHQQVNAHMPNWEPGATVVQQQFLPQHVHSQLASMPLRPIQPPNLPSQPFITEVQRQFHPANMPVQNIKQQLSSQLPTQTEHNNLVAVSTSPDLFTNPEDEEFPECDWSEHYCPDGNKYYYNCVTCESRWEKPEEYDQESQKQHKQDDHSIPCSEESQEQHKQDDHNIPCPQESQKQHKQDDHSIPCPQESQGQHKQDDHSIPCPQELQEQHKQDDHNIPCLQESQKQHKQDDHIIPCAEESQKQHKQDDHNIPCPQESQKQHKQDDHIIPRPEESQKRHKQDDHIIPCPEESQKQHKQDDHNIPCPEESQEQHKQDDHSIPCPEESQKQHKQDDHSIPCPQESPEQHKQDDHSIPCPEESQKQHKQDDHSIPCSEESQEQHKQDDHSIPCPQESQKQHKQDDHCIPCPHLSLSSSQEVSQKQQETNHDHMQSETSPVVEQV